MLRTGPICSRAHSVSLGRVGLLIVGTEGERERERKGTNPADRGDRFPSVRRELCMGGELCHCKAEMGLFPG